MRVSVAVTATDGGEGGGDGGASTEGAPSIGNGSPEAGVDSLAEDAAASSAAAG